MVLHWPSSTRSSLIAATLNVSVAPFLPVNFTESPMLSLFFSHLSIDDDLTVAQVGQRTPLHLGVEQLGVGGRVDAGENGG